MRPAKTLKLLSPNIHNSHPSCVVFVDLIVIISSVFFSLYSVRFNYMKNQPAAPQPIPPSPTPIPPTKPVFPWGIAVLVIVVIALSVGITLFLVKGSSIPFLSQTKPTYQPTASVVNTTDWKTYTNAEAGFTLKYPPTVLLNAETKGATPLVLTTDVQKLSSIPEDLPQFMGRKDALIQKERLKTGGENVVKIGSLNGEPGFSLSVFQVCSVLFERSLTFYPGDFRVIIYLNGPKEKIIKSIPDFFTIDQASCGTEQVWNREKLPVFLETLKKKEGKGAGQEWYDTFDTIIKTVTLTNVVGSPASVTMSPTNASVCDVSDNGFCNILADLKSALSAKKYAGFLAYQNLQSVTCDPDGMFVAICEGEAKGTVKQGYGIGYNQSEGTMVNKNDYVTSVFGYVNSNGPFIYRGSLISGEKGVAVFLNAKKDHILVFPLKRTDGTWRMNTLILGGTFADNSFDSLSNSLLDFVQ